MNESATVPPAAVLDAWGLGDATLVRDKSGLINQTWMIGEPGRERAVLQAVNAIFPPAVNDDIDVVTRHLEVNGLVTPRIIPTKRGTSCHTRDGVTWRVLSFVPGVTLHRLPAPALAGFAGQLLGRFHTVLAGLQIDFANKRLGVHDTPAHVRALEVAVTKFSGTEIGNAAAPLADEIMAFVDRLPTLPLDLDLAVHGDPKISNVRFAGQDGPALAMLDLDTLSRMPVCLELGDAMRSWCSLTTEDDVEADFSLAHFREALIGYQAWAPRSFRQRDLEAVAPATLTITVELAARFCTDAMESVYFSWDADRYASRSAHNLARTANQLRLARTLDQRMGKAMQIAAEIGTTHG